MKNELTLRDAHAHSLPLVVTVLSLLIWIKHSSCKLPMVTVAHVTSNHQINLYFLTQFLLLFLFWFSHLNVIPQQKERELFHLSQRLQSKFQNSDIKSGVYTFLFYFDRFSLYRLCSSCTLCSCSFGLFGSDMWNLSVYPQLMGPAAQLPLR